MNAPSPLPESNAPNPKWMSRWLLAAGLYNLIWGFGVILFPGALFALAGMEAPRYPGIWQCVGMIVGVYGIGYAIASTAPTRHWPIVLVGLLGKVFGPIGFVAAVSRGELPLEFGATILANDLIWWIPFALILRRTYEDWQQRDTARMATADSPERAISRAQTTSGMTLGDLSNERPHLVVFLRHSGCTFCSETLAEVSRLRRDRAGNPDSIDYGVVLVFPADPGRGVEKLAAKHDLGDVPRIADPSGDLYRSFGLRRGRVAQLFGPRVWWRGFLATIRGHWVGKLDGDGFRLPGAFVVHRGRIVAAFRATDASDRPDLDRMTQGACSSPAPAEPVLAESGVLS